MKFLTILKDSLREAIDTKVFYVMVGLSILVTLLTATLSFKPRSGEGVMKLSAAGLVLSDTADLSQERIRRFMLDPGFRIYEVIAAVPARGAPEGPESPYDLTLVAHGKSEADAEKLRTDPSEVVERIKQRLGRLDEWRLVEVKDVRPAAKDNSFLPKEPAPTDVFFEVAVQPTAAARRLWPHEPSLFFGALPMAFLGDAPLGLQLFVLEDTIIGGIGAWVTILISVIITAFFIPNMLRKGTVDMLLVKPIHRTALLLYKYIGGLTFIFLNTTVAVGGVWIALGLRSGIWAPSFLLTIFVITAFFAILYAISTLFAVLTRSPIVAILLTCGIWFVLWLVGLAYGIGEEIRQEEKRIAARQAEREAAKDQDPPPNQEEEKNDNPGGGRRGRRGGDDANRLPFRSDNWFFQTVGAIHFVTPRTGDLNHLMSRVLYRDLLTANQVKQQKLDDARFSWGESLTVSGLFMAILLGLSCWRFATKDY